MGAVPIFLAQLSHRARGGGGGDPLWSAAAGGVGRVGADGGVASWVRSQKWALSLFFCLEVIAMAYKVKERLYTTIEQLPEARLAEVLEFTEFLLKREHRTSYAADAHDLSEDPLLEYIGGVSHGSLAKDIDAEVYGLFPDPALAASPEVRS